MGAHRNSQLQEAELSRLGRVKAFTPAPMAQVRENRRAPGKISLAAGTCSRWSCGPLAVDHRPSAIGRRYSKLFVKSSSIARLPFS